MPPSVNNLFSNAKRGRGRFTTDRYKDWQIYAGLKLNAQKPQAIRAAAYRVCIALPLKCRADIDNLAKGPLDLLVKHGLIGDDRNVRELMIRKMVAGPDCIITVDGLNA